VEVDADRTGEDPVIPLVPRGRPSWVVALLGVVVLALVVAAALLFPRWQDARAEQARYDDGLRAATAEVIAFTTLDYRNIDPSIERVLDGATGDFKKQFSSSRDQLVALSKQNESVSVGQVLRAGVVSMDSDSARVIVVADSSVTNVNAPDPQPRHYRLQLDLVRSGERWLTSGLEFVG
jgi:Mce-associated membrane protein